METAQEIIQSSDVALPVSKKKLISALVPRVGFSSYPWLPRGLPLGASRFGGPADLPAGIEWPRVDGRPLLLMAQLNFGQLPVKRFHPDVKLLPDHGWLCLFLDLDGFARGTAGDQPGVVALQFNCKADQLVRHDPEPAPGAETWTHCHAVIVYPADHQLCLPDSDAVESPLSAEHTEEEKEIYDQLQSEIDDLARTRHEVTLHGSPTLFNPDPRLGLPDPKQWMLLLQFRGECSWLAGASEPGTYLSQPSFAGADYVQYFIRKSDYAAGRLDRGFLDYMRT